MTRETLIKKTIENLNKLPDQKLKEVSDFAEFLLDRIENQILTEGIQKITTDSNAFKFLEEEENIYTVEDLKERYK
jgi:mRNA-degrading endonuclease RelE of RelBE toxin-antitoxin system